MPTPKIIPDVTPLLPALMYATNYPRSNATMKWLNLAAGIVAAGVDVEVRLMDLNQSVQEWVDLGQDPPQEWWDEYATRPVEPEPEPPSKKPRMRKAK